MGLIGVERRKMCRRHVGAGRVTAMRSSKRTTATRAPNGSASSGGNLIDGPGKAKVRNAATLWVGGAPGGASALAGSQPT